jgi:Fe-S cluster assembly iron-binding protein IscA
MNLSITQTAAEHLQRELDGRILRIAFTTGCGGSGYRLAFSDAPIDGDEVVHVSNIRVALDNMSASRLDGAIIEYDADEDGYLLDHPDAVSAVWCG